VSFLAEHEKKLASLSIVLGALYVGAAAIFLFGVFAAASVRRPSIPLIPLSLISQSHYTETLGPYPHILLPGRRSGRYRNCIRFSANDSPLHAQGKDILAPSFSFQLN